MTRTPAEPLADGEMIETDDIIDLINVVTDLADADAMDRAIPEVRARIEKIVAAALSAYNPNDRLREALEAGQEAYREGYHNGFLDAQVTDESGPFCSDDAILSRIDGVAMAEGWDAHSDTFAAALRALTPPSELTEK